MRRRGTDRYGEYGDGEHSGEQSRGDRYGGDQYRDNHHDDREYGDDQHEDDQYEDAEYDDGEYRDGQYREDDHGSFDDIDGLLGDETAPIRRRGYRAEQRTRHEANRRRRSAGPKLIAMIVVLATLLGLGIYGVGKVVGRLGGSGESTADYPGPGSGETIVQIAEGATTRDIGRVLAAADVVGSAGAFVAAAAADPESLGIQPGYYRLRTKMSAAQALAALLDPGANSLYRFTITEGMTVQQILTALSERTGVAMSEFQKVIDNPAELGLPSYATTVEGYLFPSTYDLIPGAPPAETLKMFVDKFHTEVASLDLENAAARGNMSPQEIVTVASIIEKEVANQQEGPRVARVIYNRLNDATGQFTRLDMDSTTRYAFNLTIDQPLTQQHLTTPHPYNTRAVAGLPPGAISNPGLWALRSALEPAQGSWLYFVSLPQSGETIFATTSEEWESALARYRSEGGD